MQTFVRNARQREDVEVTPVEHAVVNARSEWIQPRPRFHTECFGNAAVVGRAVIFDEIMNLQKQSVPRVGQPADGVGQPQVLSQRMVVNVHNRVVR